MFSRKSPNDTNTTYGGDQNTNTSHNNPNATTYGTDSSNTEGGRGPHRSSLLNKLDPRVDSKTGQPTSSTSRNDGGAFGTDSRHDNSGYGSSNTGPYDNTGYGSGTTGYNTGSTNAGPHNSNLANKVSQWSPKNQLADKKSIDHNQMDPPGDSELDHSGTRISRDSGYGTQHHSGYSNPSSNTGYGTSNTTTGPHNSSLLNKADPRVDSDNSRGNYGNTTGYDSNPNTTGYSNTTGYGSPTSPTSGPHNSSLANKVDPRVDSDNSRSNYGNTTSTYNNPNNSTRYGTSYGDNRDTTTDGPHKSKLLNKLDPRVDSDMDGSRNMGMNNNQGIGQSNTTTIPQEVSSHGHATGPPAGALEGRHAKHTAGPPLPSLNASKQYADSYTYVGNITNATANASVKAGPIPEGSASASGPTSADAGTTTSNQGGLKGAIRNLGSG